MSTIKLWSWNVACGGPSVGAARWERLRTHFNDSDADVLLLQEAKPDLVDADQWQIVSAAPTGPRGSCSVVAVRSPAPPLQPVPQPVAVPADRDFCVAVADWQLDLASIRLVSLYVPWHDSSATWIDGLLNDPLMQVPAGLLGADLNSPVGPKPPLHPMFALGEKAGWTWASMPLFANGPTMKMSQIDHLLVRGVAAQSWSVDPSVLEAKLSDHALLQMTFDLASA